MTVITTNGIHSRIFNFWNKHMKILRSIIITSCVTLYLLLVDLLLSHKEPSFYVISLVQVFFFFFYEFRTETFKRLSADQRYFAIGLTLGAYICVVLVGCAVLAGIKL